jgi:hypothetical protein
MFPLAPDEIVKLVSFADKEKSGSRTGIAVETEAANCEVPA